MTHLSLLLEFVANHKIIMDYICETGEDHPPPDSDRLHDCQASDIDCQLGNINPGLVTRNRPQLM